MGRAVRILSNMHQVRVWAVLDAAMKWPSYIDGVLPLNGAERYP
jgi:hypothetical protein